MSSKIETIARKINKAYRAGRKISTTVMIKLDKAIRATDNLPQAKAYRAAAKARWAREGDDIEIDDDSVVSASEEGAFISAWVFVPKDDLK